MTDPVRLTEAILAVLVGVQDAIDEANERADDAVAQVRAVRDTLRWERERHTE